MPGVSVKRGKVRASLMHRDTLNIHGIRGGGGGGNTVVHATLCNLLIFDHFSQESSNCDDDKSVELPRVE